MHISFNQIKALNIDPSKFIEWVKEAFERKYSCVLPHKISMKYYDDGFVNVMPSIIPSEGVYGVKVVSRNKDSIPTLKGDIFLFDIATNNPICSLDGTYITAMRTGAVAALTINVLAKKNYESIAVMGLGNVGRAFIKCWLTTLNGRSVTLKLLKFNHDEDDVVKYLKPYSNINIVLCDSTEEFIKDSDVVVSAITVANSLVGEEQWFKPGCLLIPVHTRGFQNCDATFDMVECDDVSHVEGFGNFSQFKNLTEMSEILNGSKPGRVSDTQRILAYNIGISLHDILIANKIRKEFGISATCETNEISERFWVF